MNTDFISHSLHLTELQQQQRSLYLKGMSREFPVKKKADLQGALVSDWAAYNSGLTFWQGRPQHWWNIWTNGACVAPSPSEELRLRRCTTICCLKTFIERFFDFFFLEEGRGANSSWQHWYLLSHCSLLWVAVVLMRPRHQCCVCRYEQRHVSATDTVQTCFPGGHVSK